MPLASQLAAHAIDELLIGSKWRAVHLFIMRQHRKGLTKLRMQLACGIAHHRQATALKGTIGSKGCDDDMPARFDRMLNLTHVGCTFFCRSQEVKNRPVVPQVHAMFRKGSTCDVSHHPLHTLGQRSEATLTLCQCRR